MKQIYFLRFGDFIQSQVLLPIICLFIFTLVGAIEVEGAEDLKGLFEANATFQEEKYLESNNIPLGLDHVISRSLLANDQLSEVYAADIVDNQHKIGALLIVKSFDEVYEPTKYIVNRLEGAVIEEVFNYTFRNIYSFVVAKYRTPEGKTAFSTNFSTYNNAEGLHILESHWHKESYPRGFEFNNIQTWAENLVSLEISIAKVLNQVMDQAGNFEEMYATKSPGVYIAKQQFQNGFITLEIVNENQVGEITVIEETSNRAHQPKSYQLSLSGFEREEVTIPAGSATNLEGFLKVKKSKKPVVDLGNGSWGVFYQQGEAAINSFHIEQLQAKENNQEYLVSNNINVAGRFRGQVTFHRTMNPQQAGLDISTFNTLSFVSTGVGQVEVILLLDGIEEFDQQPSITVNLDPNLEQQSFDFSAFSGHEYLANGGHLLKSIAFVLDPQPGVESDVIDWSIQQIRFK